MITVGRLSVLALVVAAPLAAQTRPAARHGGLAHYGKWLTAAAAVAFTGLAAHEYARSDDAFRRLLNACRADATSCARTASGVYVNAANEALYQTSIQYERRARVRLFAGQAGVLLTVGLFLADRGHHPNGPGNIPFQGLIVVQRDGGGARVGMRVKF